MIMNISNLVLKYLVCFSKLHSMPVFKSGLNTEANSPCMLIRIQK